MNDELFLFNLHILDSDGSRVPEIRISEVPRGENIYGVFKRQVEQGFSSFFATLLAYLMIFQSFTAPSCSADSSGSSKFDFGYPIRH